MKVAGDVYRDFCFRSAKVVQCFGKRENHNSLKDEVIKIYLLSAMTNFALR